MAQASVKFPFVCVRVPRAHAETTTIAAESSFFFFVLPLQRSPQKTLSLFAACRPLIRNTHSPRVDKIKHLIPLPARQPGYAIGDAPTIKQGTIIF